MRRRRVACGPGGSSEMAASVTQTPGPVPPGTEVTSADPDLARGVASLAQLDFAAKCSFSRSETAKSPPRSTPGEPASPLTGPSLMLVVRGPALTVAVTAHVRVTSGRSWIRTVCTGDRRPSLPPPGHGQRLLLGSARPITSNSSSSTPSSLRSWPRPCSVPAPRWAGHTVPQEQSPATL